ncbi:lactate utilization protein B/C [Ginsengibacter hankyongi]|uniref:Lactate utilization protein B/C n=1 Tax=Ginsengibacter hankyongi TaxID=2607284 RepID=A0A5J5IMY9_9BACT|nr:lactate utilization protein [Ginsengibacter hankyongi]KAA9041703.1 lactate utilization protein B/C [Ginsengibacter hankyongi]
MRVSSSKEKILKKIREALTNPVPLPFPKSEGTTSVFPQQKEDLEITFAEEFTKLLGKFAFCVSEADMKHQLQKLLSEKKWTNIFCKEDSLVKILNDGKLPKLNQSTLADCDVSITTCEYLIARTGSIVMTSAQQSGRTVSAYAPVHICIAYINQLVYDTRDALKLLKTKYGNSFPSFITFAAGPSRTADIEKTLVVGVHGPKEVYLFLIDEQAK